VSIASADQAHFYAGHLTVPRADPDLPALQVLSVILGSGSGLSGRLPLRLREREGLAYAASASAAAGAGLDPGRFFVYLGTAVESLERAESCMREEIDRLVSQGVSEREVEEAKSYLIGRDPFRRETARQWAGLLAEAELYGDPVDLPEWCANRWREVSREGVDAAVRQHIRPAEIKVTVGVPS
jgi:zinc protease